MQNRLERAIVDRLTRLKTEICERLELAGLDAHKEMLTALTPEVARYVYEKDLVEKRKRT